MTPGKQGGNSTDPNYGGSKGARPGQFTKHEKWAQK